MNTKRLNSLLKNYWRNETPLREYVEKHFPPGTRVKSTVTGNEYIVKVGSEFADQLKTNLYHVPVSNVVIIHKAGSQ